MRADSRLNFSGKKKSVDLETKMTIYAMGNKYYLVTELQDIHWVIPVSGDYDGNQN